MVAVAPLKEDIRRFKHGRGGTNAAGREKKRKSQQQCHRVKTSIKVRVHSRLVVILFFQKPRQIEFHHRDMVRVSLVPRFVHHVQISL